MDFLRDEVRSGFYIPTAIKQAWSASLKILAEIDRICEKYGIKYYAEWGSLLGAVRHGGFIPWDDDLDIGMLREDYNRFCLVADKELPEGYAFHTYKSKNDHWLFLSRVVNTNQICYDLDHLNRFDNFPYIACIDIFVSDYRYADEELEKKRCDEVKRIIAIADGIVNKTFGGPQIENLLCELESKYKVHISRGISNVDIGRELYALAEKQMARTTAKESDRIVQLFPWGLKGATGLPKEYYEDFIRLSFENTSIPVPAQYVKVLSNRYGDFMRIHKIWGGHDYPYFEKQRENLLSVADFEIPEFRFDNGLLRKNLIKDEENISLKELASECISEIDRLISVSLSSEDTIENRVQALVDCQQLVVDLGTLIESAKGEGSRWASQIIPKLEELCEQIYLTSEGLCQGENNSDTENHLLICTESAIKCVKELILEKKQVLFVTTGEKEWKSFELIYESYVNDDSYNVDVVWVPLYKKDALGQIISEADNGYVDTISNENWEVYNTSLVCPDIVFYQDPYDAENPCITIPKAFYSSELQKCSEKLIYVPAFLTNEFGAADLTDISNMKYYVTAPAVVRADEVWVQSENIRDRYIEALTAFAGDETRSHWENTVKENQYLNKLESDQQGKTLLYCVGLDEVYSHKSDIEQIIKNRLDIIRDGLDKKELDFEVCVYPDCVDKSRDLVELIKGMDVSVVSSSDILSGNISKYCAYYGSATPLAHKFNFMSKPVMVSNYDLK